MLSSLRKKTAGIVIKVILGLIIISFAVWGVEDAFRMRGSNTVASVGDTNIGVQAFSDRYNRTLQTMAQQFGRPLSPADGRSLGIDRRVLGEMMAEATLQEQAKRLRLGVSEAAIADAIMKDENFRGPNGQFDATRFDMILRSNNLNEPMYVDLQRNMMLRQQILKGLVGGVAAPQTLTNAVFQHQSERRSVNYVVLPGSDGSDIAAPDDPTLQAFFEERKGAFRAPETRGLAVLAALPGELAAKETVSEEDLQARFEQDKERLGTPERRTLERITFPTIADAQAASAKIKAGTSFEDIAAEQNIAAGDISMGAVAKADILDTKIADAAFALAPNEISDAVEGQFSNVILRVTTIEPAVVPDFAAVREELRKDIATQRAADKILALHDAIEDDRASGMNLTEIAAKHGLSVQTFDGVDAQGQIGADPVNVPGGPTVIGQAFESDVGVENNAVQVPGGGYVWFDVTKVDTARDRTFDEAKDEVLKAWRLEEARKRLDAKAEETLKALQGGSLTLADLATREGTQVQTLTELNRTGGALGQSAGARIFATARNGFGSAPDSEEGRVVFQLVGIDTPELDPASDAARQLSERLAQTLDNDLATQYVTQLQNDLGATINNQTLTTAIGGVQQ